MRFYGMGEKNGRLEKSLTRTVFWNTDAGADFPPHEVAQASFDPMYVAVPYLLVRLAEDYIGILVDNPYPVFMSTGASESIAKEMIGEAQTEDFFIGSTDGMPVLYLIHGRSAGEVTCKLQRLCGTTPLPPLWALGHQQSRWGYGSASDLISVAARFEENLIPNDGLWLDIDYMDGYRVFTTSPDRLPEPGSALRSIAERGFHVVAILDPGIKVDEEFEPYKDGLLKDVFCKNAENRPFVGFVWPGATVFPDFSLPEVRAWWAERVAALSKAGFAGFWLRPNTEKPIGAYLVR